MSKKTEELRSCIYLVISFLIVVVVVPGVSIKLLNILGELLFGGKIGQFETGLYYGMAIVGMCYLWFKYIFNYREEIKKRCFSKLAVNIINSDSTKEIKKNQLVLAESMLMLYEDKDINKASQIVESELNLEQKLKEISSGPRYIFNEALEEKYMKQIGYYLYQIEYNYGFPYRRDRNK
ncbi:MAG: hypothetical protein A2452_12960 [Candidatus Firestonebacteria bacterium RIFOXYC2_FULL_39_67]|nr:MAG: hypothetical protein A2536_04450 [Candidatus Firestonebacteria bacterium RIFOXYD2_FULL_39_29]OGF55022.1 MAG: hypothetical protein A2452_12960 [Candidatus Firestonebacteria bacterium RIFOXYC2_FULL_39_67]